MNFEIVDEVLSSVFEEMFLEVKFLEKFSLNFITICNSFFFICKRTKWINFKGKLILEDALRPLGNFIKANKMISFTDKYLNTKEIMLLVFQNLGVSECLWMFIRLSKRSDKFMDVRWNTSMSEKRKWVRDLYKIVFEKTVTSFVYKELSQNKIHIFVL